MSYDLTVASSHYIERLSTPVTAEPLTMACWFNKNNATTSEVLMTVGDSAGTSRWQLQASGASGGDPVEAFSITSGGASSVSSAIGFAAGQWQHAAGVFASTVSRLAYVNGAPTGGPQTTSRSVTGVNSIGIGMGFAAGTRAGFFGGKIAEAAIWNVALTADEVAALGQGYSPQLIRPASLVFYAPLIRSAVDVRGAALTVSGAAVADHARVRLR